ncbi:MAG: PQQ-binding-like beta-propeller repeat protein [Acidobacteria bacterium]|nr:PQQ-binding-like beta-propeller repeat protein [Acidobacteriota bacterium]MCI0665367.1 PQQ-binding-like beta-propeller repeat protein [Acidobacteriota bacterium]
MPNNSIRFSLLFTIILLVSNPHFASDDWTRFRGPNGTGISSSANLPVEFGPEKNVVWKTPLPPGHSSPVFTHNRIFLTAFENDRLLVIGLDRNSGKVLWKNEAPRPRKDRLQKPNNPASPSPVTDGENVYTFFQDFGMISFDANGKERWRLPMGPFTIYYGFGASPIIVDDKIILPCDQDTTSYLLAVDRKTGKVKWKVDRPGVISGYSTPIIYQPKNGQKQIIIAESFQLSAYSPQDGERLWHVRGLACEMKSVPSLDGDVLYINGWGWPENQPGLQIYLPSLEEVMAKNDTDKDGKISPDEMPNQKLKQKVYFGTFDTDQDGKLNAREWEICRAMMASENGLLSIKLGGKGDMSANAIRWKYQKPVPQVPSTLLYQGALFMVNDSGILISFDPATGNVIKQGRLKGAIDKYFASPVGADGKVYLISQDGTVSVVKAAGEWEVLAVNPLGDEVFATPAIVDGKLYVRTQSALYCFAKQN